MKDYYIEIFNPPFPNKGRKVRLFTQRPLDCLSPSLIALFRVKAEDKQDALAKALLGKAFAMISPEAKQLVFA